MLRFYGPIGLIKKNGVCLFAFFVIVLSCASVSFSQDQDQGYVFSFEGKYLVLDKTNYQIIKEGDLWNDIFVADKKKAEEKKELEKQKKDLKTYINYKILPTLKVIDDVKGNRIFLLIGVPKAEEYYGYLVLRRNDLKFIHMIKQKIDFKGLGAVSINLKVCDGKIYLTYFHAEGSEGEGSFITVVYDGQSYKKVNEYKDTNLKINRATCVLEDSLYTNGRLFDKKTDTVIREDTREDTSLGRLGMPANCEKGLLLFFSKTEPTSEPRPVILSLFDVRKGRVMKEIRTEEMILSFNGEEWRLSPDTRFIIRNEQKSIPLGQESMAKITGRLVIFDTNNGSKKEVQVPVDADNFVDSEISSFSSDGSRLIYRSAKRLFIIDLEKASIIKESQLPFAPVGTIWP